MHVALVVLLLLLPFLPPPSQHSIWIEIDRGREEKVMEGKEKKGR